jgi:hypothetical protein
VPLSKPKALLNPQYCLKKKQKKEKCSFCQPVVLPMCLPLLQLSREFRRGRGLEMSETSSSRTQQRVRVLRLRTKAPQVKKSELEEEQISTGVN